MANGEVYIGFEGPIGAGKTTLATLLARAIAATLMLENFQGNEFLSDFYTDAERWALPMQLGFLASRSSQLRAVPALLERPVVADHTYAKDAMFARTLLTGRELRLYEKVAEAIGRHIRRPDLIVYLDAPDDVLLTRIRRRGREYEASIDTPYLRRLRDAYAAEFLPAGGRADARVLRVDTSVLNLESADELRAFYAEVVEAAHGVKEQPLG
jgi:deoxyguanosine kinase